MNIQISHANPQSSAEIFSAAKTRRLMFWGRPERAKPIRSLPAPKIEQPLWQTANIRFDEHVEAYEAQTSPAKYISWAARNMGSSDEEVTGDGQHAKIVRIREAIAHALRFRFNLSYPCMAELMNRDTSTLIARVRAHCRTLGEPYGNEELSVVSDDTIAEIRTEFETGRSLESACRARGMLLSVVKQIAMDQGWYVRRDQSFYNTKPNVTVKQVREVWETGIGQVRIAKFLGTSRHKVENIIRAEGWKR